MQQDTLFSTVIPEEGIPLDPPLRPIRKLPIAQLLVAFYTIRGERQLMEQIDYNLLFRWLAVFSIARRLPGTFRSYMRRYINNGLTSRKGPEAGVQCHSR